MAIVILKTNIEVNGSNAIKIYVDEKNAPITAQNFLNYVNEGFYTNTLFHRVIPNFMVQGGGLDEDMATKPTHRPIKNEADNGLQNKRTTIAMARTSDPHSATGQFFINVVDNPFLNHQNQTPQGWGYCVFGYVTEGMEVVDAIVAKNTVNRNGYQNVPEFPILITGAEVAPELEATPQAAKAEERVAILAKK